MTTSHDKTRLEGAELIALAEKIDPLLSLLPSGMTLLVENLFPHKEWQGMTGYQRRKTGEMLALLVKENMLSLEFLSTNNSTQRYINK